MAKKILSFIGASLFSVALVACGGSQKSDTTTPPAQPAMSPDGGMGAGTGTGTGTGTGAPAGNPCNAPAGGPGK